jgi:hypothetical protein
MNPRNRTSPASCLIAYSTAAGLALCAVIAPSDAADRSNNFMEMGRPRDLVNQPDCWTREHSEEWYRCAVGVR